MNDQIMVSICCTAYNHEKYIRRALDGFVSKNRRRFCICNGNSGNNWGRIYRW